MLPVAHKVYVGAHRPLTLWGVDRRVWAFVACGFLAMYGLVPLPYGLLAGLVLSLTLWALALYFTRRDPYFLSLALAIFRPGHRLRLRLDCSIPPRLR